MPKGRAGEGSAPKGSAFPTLSLDLASTMGWALDTTGELHNGREKDLTTGTVEFGRNRTEFVNWLECMIKEHGIKSVVYEKVNFIANNSRRGNNFSFSQVWIFGFFRTVVEDTCRAKKITATGIPVSTIRSLLIGNSRASKDTVVTYLKRIGYNFHTHDEADAIACLLVSKILEKTERLKQKCISKAPKKSLRFVFPDVN